MWNTDDADWADQHGRIRENPLHPCNPCSIRSHELNVIAPVRLSFQDNFGYVRLPNPAFDYSRAALDGFRAEMEKRLTEREHQLLARVAATDPLIYVNTYGRQVWAGVGAYRISVESAVEKIKAARDIGVEGFVLFSYDSAIRVSDLNPDGRLFTACQTSGV